jgi:hypothetical protein
MPDTSAEGQATRPRGRPVRNVRDLEALAARTDPER